MTKEQFKKIRISKGYTQEELAEKFGYRVQQISKMENGRASIGELMAFAMFHLPKKSR